MEAMTEQQNHIDNQNSRIERLESAMQTVIMVGKYILDESDVSKTFPDEHTESLELITQYAKKLIEIATAALTQPEDPPVSACGPSRIGPHGTDGEPGDMIAGGGHPVEISREL
jgi:hypothetical protein